MQLHCNLLSYHYQDKNMASITKKSNGTWLAQVRHKAQHGRPAIHRSATFERKADAAAWAARIEEEWRMVKHGLSPCIPFRDVLQRYANEITPKKRGARSETYRLNHLMQSDLAAIMLPDLTDLPFREWVKQQQTEISTDTLLREWTTLSHVLTVAVKEWRLLPENYLLRLQKPKQAPRVRAALVSRKLNRYLLGSRLCV